MSYLSQNELQFNIAPNDIQTVSLDSYNETAILKKVKTNNVQELFAAALQISLVGIGNKTYGAVMLKGHKKDLVDIFRDNHVNYSSSQNSKLEIDELTPRRLCRVFRFQISAYIKSTGNHSYLYKKYSDDIDIEPENCFPGSEYMVDKESFPKLVLVYKNIDKRFNISISERLSRINSARIASS